MVTFRRGGGWTLFLYLLWVFLITSQKLLLDENSTKNLNLPQKMITFTPKVIIFPKQYKFRLCAMCLQIGGQKQTSCGQNYSCSLCTVCLTPPCRWIHVTHVINFFFELDLSQLWPINVTNIRSWLGTSCAGHRSWLAVLAQWLWPWSLCTPRCAQSSSIWHPVLPASSLLSPVWRCVYKDNGFCLCDFKSLHPTEGVLYPLAHPECDEFNVWLVSKEGGGGWVSI